MKAAVLREVNTSYKIEDVTLNRDVKANEVKVKIIATGMCHSDEAIRTGQTSFGFPGILGHEGAGIVEEVGPGVLDIEQGDHVVLTDGHCGHCEACLSGNPSVCDYWEEINISGTSFDGSKIFKGSDKKDLNMFYNQSSFTEYTITHRNNVVKVDKDLDLRILGPLGCGFLTGSGTVFNGLKPSAGDSIAVFGTGAVGLSAIISAKISGCYPIVAVDIHENRLELAKELGATHVINSKNEEVLAQVDKFTSQRGVNYTIDTTGVPAVMEFARDSLAKNGVAALVAVTDKTFETSPFVNLAAAQRTIKGVLMGDSVSQIEIPKLIQYYRRGLFPFDKLIKFYNFKDINEAAEDSNSGKVIKPVLIVDELYTP
ncbi:NAD(P)-dependent alcohol dehydrogenase [Staphylococcus saprophyticus]|uniref:Aryl-alcohol dehydrogenase n=1 Tax=Staphylococcus saprophyticus subsp. saprophyticus MS1146 TaxID=881952 RepID=F4MSR2_STASA|nr:NAD(P)-dependent alcohol dehydrogenase [Staphylococcus saprophyticus]NJE84194.1 NAD(P)-dependent alcohol dehydrogenase [Staphylococcus saprophyticus]CBW54946.1 aryl-alcohol dehydrogenase [Staphylococcus saprophyticus subsp. saprophyticus MS1146]